MTTAWDSDLLAGDALLEAGVEPADQAGDHPAPEDTGEGLSDGADDGAASSDEVLAPTS